MGLRTYRPDIDGLRAVAVIPVVLFHLGVSWIPGGFVGVDVFFVISGYLITGIIADEIAQGRFSILNFYERRIRRIFPALFCMIGVTLGVGAVFMMPADFSELGQSAVAAVLFASNLLFWSESGYFDPSAYTKPLLHTWSLAIEEQFYVIMPLVMLALARVRAQMGVWIAGLVLLSLALSVFYTRPLPTAGFYLLPWRAWELGIGALLALGAVPAPRGRALRETVAGAGLVMILLAFVWIDEHTLFPGTAALLPTVGTAAVILACQHGPTLTGRLLSTALPVWIGRRSYSLYLWHWPMIVFYVYWTFDMPGPAAMGVLFVVSMLVAGLSWRYVEQPFRRPPGGPGRGRLFAAAGAGMVCLAVAGGAIWVSSGLPQRLPPDVLRIAQARTDKDPRYDECLTRINAEADWATPCLYGAPGDTAQIALWGDSNGPALIPALEAAGQNTGKTVALFARLGCPPVEGFEWHDPGNENYWCGAFYDTALQTILNSPALETVVITMRPALYTQGWFDDFGFGEVSFPPIEIGTRTHIAASDAERNAFYFGQMEKTIQTLTGAGKRVVLVYPIPVYANHIPTVLARKVARGENPETVSIPRQYFDDRNAAVFPAFDRLVAEYDLIPVKPHLTLCDADSCAMYRDGVVLYHDRSHLSRTAAQQLSDLFEAALADHEQ